MIYSSFGTYVSLETKNDLDKIGKSLNLSRSLVITNLVSAIKNNDTKILEYYHDVLTQKKEK